MEDYQRWMEFMRSRRGQWTIDQIHSGREGSDFLVFCPTEGDETKGVFVRLDRSGMCEAGVFEDATPHIGDASFKTRWAQAMGSDFDKALVALRVRLGLI